MGATIGMMCSGAEKKKALKVAAMTGQQGTCPMTGLPAGPAAVPGAVAGRVSLSEASDDRGSFVRFIKNAAADDQSPEFKELRQFLIRCFVDCDTDFDGLIGPADFDKLVERAGALPRKWGFAPTTQEMFANDAPKLAFRKKTFKEVDTAGLGSFAIDQWLDWSLKHIRVKAQLLSYANADTKRSTSAEGFREFIIAAARSRHCPEYKELYHFLQDCFNAADDDHSGLVDAWEFDKMIELAADAPRKFGFAPPSNETYRSDAERIAARKAMFQQILAKNQRGLTEKISFNAWLEWSYAHICAKAKVLDPSLSGEPPALDDFSKAGYGTAATRAKSSARGISAQLANDNKEAFIKFIKAVAASKESPEYKELHHYLLQCFVECDLDFDGLIKVEDFDGLVERAGALPRKWGFAPTTNEMFKTVDQRVAFRQNIFKDINKSNSGTIYFDEWMEWSYKHICQKASLLNEAQAESKMESSQADFRAWVIAAARTRASPEYKELYHFLQECFMRADDDQSGLVDATEFDKMIELAAAAPRKFGFAPPTNTTYKNDEERIRARTAMFDAIAANNKRNFRDKIGFNAWLEWSYSHICQKAKVLDPNLSGVAPPVVAQTR
mmetsp:Transcript_26835/g.73795  ORF Transcript_26835/g.73795 Transcript_26835/m.73795 type:complete len:612 (-) Transcript_26835:174-2009(-)